MHFAQAVSGHVRIDFGCGDAGMPEQLLDDAQIGPVLEQVRREAMAQHVRGHVARDAGPADPLLDRSQSVTGAKAVPRLVRKTLPGERGRTS